MSWLLLTWLAMVTVALGALWGRFHRAETMLHRRISAHTRLPVTSAHPRSATDRPR